MQLYVYIPRQRMSQLNPQGVTTWGSGLRRLASFSVSQAGNPSEYNRNRLQGRNTRTSVHGVGPIGPGRPPSSMLPFGGAIAQVSQAKALPPDLYNKNRLTGSNKRVTYIGLGPRSTATASALMKSGEIPNSKEDQAAVARDINVDELVSGLKSALEVADTEEQRDVISHQLATLRPFVLLTKKRDLTEQEQQIVNNIGQTLLSQAEEEVAAQTADDDQYRIELGQQDTEQVDYANKKYLAEVLAQKADEAKEGQIRELEQNYNEAGDYLARAKQQLRQDADGVKAEQVQLVNMQAGNKNELKQLTKIQRKTDTQHNKADRKIINYDQRLAKLTADTADVVSEIERLRKVLIDPRSKKSSKRQANSQLLLEEQLLRDFTKSIDQTTKMKEKALNDKANLEHELSNIDSDLWYATNDKANIEQRQAIARDRIREIADEKKVIKDKVAREQRDIQQQANDIDTQVQDLKDNVMNIVASRPVASVVPMRQKVIPRREADKLQKARREALRVLDQVIDPLRGDLADLKNISQGEASALRDVIQHEISNVRGSTQALGETLRAEAADLKDSIYAVLRAWESNKPGAMQDQDILDDADIIISASPKELKFVVDSIDDEKRLPKGSAAQDLSQALEELGPPEFKQAIEEGLTSKLVEDYISAEVKKDTSGRPPKNENSLTRLKQLALIVGAKYNSRSTRADVVRAIARTNPSAFVYMNDRRGKALTNQDVKWFANALGLPMPVGF